MSGPRLYDQRIVQTEVGGALPGGPWPAWAVERYDRCDCPNCEEQGHWRSSRSPYKTREDAEEAMRTHS